MDVAIGGAGSIGNSINIAVHVVNINMSCSRSNFMMTGFCLSMSKFIIDTNLRYLSKYCNRYSCFDLAQANFDYEDRNKQKKREETKKTVNEIGVSCQHAI